MTKFVHGGRPRRKYQLRALRRVIETKGVTALLLDPGLGKTAVVLDYASLLALKSPTEEARVLVVCPLAAVDSWVIQAEEWISPQVNYWAEVVEGSVMQKVEALAARGGDPFPRIRHRKGEALRPPKLKKGEAPRAHGVSRTWAVGSRPEVKPQDGPDAVPGPRVVLEVLNLDTFSQRRSLGPKNVSDYLFEAVRRFQPDLVVVDESHKIKGAGANASKLLGRVAEYVPRRIILTGTVMPHSPADVFGQWRFLEPYAFGWTDPQGRKRKATMSGFEDRFAVKGGFMGREIIRWTNLDVLHEIMARNSIVIRKEDALDLPPVQSLTLPVHLSPREERAYASMKKELAALIRDEEGRPVPAVDEDGEPLLATVSSKLVQAMRLRQITAGHIKADDGEVHELGTSKVDTIASHVNDTLAGEKRVVVFGVFKHELAALAKALDVPGTEVLKIDGETPKPVRQQYRQRFGSDDPARLVIVAQISTLNLAVNELVTASHAVFSSLNRQRDDYEQAMGRLDRSGQTRPVTFWHAVAPGTVDEVILRAFHRQESLETAVLAHVQDLA